MLTDLVNTLLGIELPNLNTKRYGDVYDILNNRPIDYCAFIVEAVSAREAAMSEITLRLTVVDMLMEDESNLLQVFDNCHKMLHDILLHLPDDVEYQEYSVDFIKQDFADHLAGVYADITFTTEPYTCEYYGKE